MSVDKRVGMSLDECAEHGYLARLLCLSIIFYAFNYANYLDIKENQSLDISSMHLTTQTI